MRLARGAALLHAAVTAAVVAFQLALAAGAPWGEYAMGGAFPGTFPPAMRIAAVVQAALLAAFAGLVLVRAGVLPGRAEATRRPVWGIVGLGAVSLALNLATPSPRERAVWAPVAAVLFATGLAVARSPLPAR